MTQYHVTLDSQGYILDLVTYEKSVATPFAPQQRDGDPGYGDLAQASIWSQADWSGGVDTRDYDPARPTGYFVGTPLLATGGPAEPGVELSSAFAPASVTDLWRFDVYNNRLYCIRGDGTNVYESSNATAWSSVYAPAGPSAWRSIGRFDNLLLVGSSSNGEVHRYNGTAWASWGTVGGSPTGIHAIREWWTSYASRLAYLGVTKSSGRASLYSASTAPTFTEIAETPYDRIEALEAWDGALWIGAVSDTNGHRGALYRYTASSFALVQALDDNAPTSFAVFDNRLYAASATRGKVWQVTTAGLEEVFQIPDVVGVGGISAYALDVRQLLVFNDRLYLSVVDANGLGVWCWDGIGWHNVAAGGAGQEPRGIGALNGIVCLSNKSNAGARIHTLSTTAFQSGAVLITQWFNAGLPSATKAAVRATVRHEALASGESITLEYEVDESGTWTSLVTSDTDGARAKTASFAAATTFTRIRFRVTWTMSAATASPQLQELVLEYDVVPTPKARWTFDVFLEGTAELPLITLDQAADPKSGAQLADTLWASKAKLYPLAFTDLDGEIKTVYLRDIREHVAPISQRQGLSTRARVTLVEA
jgi:hypothetical protein